MTRVTLTRRIRSRRLARGLILLSAAACLLGGICAASLVILNQSRRNAQMKTDPRVATVWMLGVTRGKTHTLQRGTTVQKWLNEKGVRALGSYRVLQGGYPGNPGSLEVWFDYDSHIRGQRRLVCRRVGQTAFVDDLGQLYHGYLDFQGRVVGVYLPGYDRAARRLLCYVRWMPRPPAAPVPTSRPMAFTIELPPARRLLPAADTLPRGPVAQAQGEVTVAVRGAWLSAPKPGGVPGAQRELKLHLKIMGGELACINVGPESPARAFRLSYGGLTGSPAFPAAPPPASSAPAAPEERKLRLTDPYGIALIPEAGMITAAALRGDGELLLTAPVNGAGRGTDAVRLRFAVRPSGSASPLPFDMTIPVQSSQEI